ncbi:glycoside hydrolase family 28 protein [Opitutales bacterium ASA1]|uniref:glycoside hydrolase family 28 protein n=1 Tax=Congregicoccus parvus TaxID=3081749 RepID=UPI002B30E871|nr:glycoside hydrolase family 28 protein [Opitutales bacterium ASA1]
MAASVAVLAGLLLCSQARAVETRHAVTDFGATPDGKTLVTGHIQAAIDFIHHSGGGTVVVPAGVFRTGAIFLKQGVALHLEKDAVLLGSNDIEDYPRRATRIEGHFPVWRTALINAEGIHGLRISGEGTIDGNGVLFWAAYWQRRKENPQCTNLEVERPRMFFIDRCTDVRISGLRLRDSGFWNVHLYRCQDVLIEDLDIFSPGTVPIRAPSTDGIDIDSCQRVTVRRCTISVDDDCIAIKGSKGPLADRDASSPPVEDILIEDCTFGTGHGVVTFGSEATVVRNVTVRNCTVKGLNNLVRLKLRPDTPQLYENVVYENIVMEGDGRLFDVQPWRQFYDPQGHEPPPSIVRNVTVRNVTGSCRRLGVLAGNPGDTIEDIRLENLDLRAEDTNLRLGGVRGIVFENVRVNGSPFSVPTN